jgi:photosystem II stability/assembly factor-like uncharacterized protein
MPFIFPPLTIFLLLCSLSHSSFADELSAKKDNSIITIPSTEARLASKSLLLDITKVNPNKLVVVGEHGHILLSSDAVNWQQAKVPLQTTLTSVFFINSDLGWAVGHDATILNTVDGGSTWQIQQYKPELEKPLFDIVFKTPSEGIAIGAYGLVFRTQDGGASWNNEFHTEFLLPEDAEYLAEIKKEVKEAEEAYLNETSSGLSKDPEFLVELKQEVKEIKAVYLDETSSILPHFNRLVLDNQTLYMVGEIGLVAQSDNFGVDWVPFDDIYQGSFFDISKTAQGDFLVVGLRGHVFKSADNGMTWQAIQTNTTSLINDIVLSEDDRIFLLANNGTLLESKDKGQSYQLKTQKDGKSLIAGVWFNGKLIVVSDVGVKQISL